MNAALDAIRDDLRTFRQRVAKLEKAEALVVEAWETEPTPDPPEVEKSRADRSPRSKNPTSDEIVEFLRRHGPAGRGEIHTARGGNIAALDRKLKNLLRKGVLAADGSPRQYTVAIGKEPMAKRPDSGRYPVYDALIENGPSTTTEVADHTGLSSHQVFAQARELTRQGIVGYTGNGTNRIWHTNPTRGPQR